MPIQGSSLFSEKVAKPVMSKVGGAMSVSYVSIEALDKKVDTFTKDSPWLEAYLIMRERRRKRNNYEYN